MTNTKTREEYCVYPIREFTERLLETINKLEELSESKEYKEALQDVKELIET